MHCYISHNTPYNDLHVFTFTWHKIDRRHPRLSSSCFNISPRKGLPSCSASYNAQFKHTLNTGGPWMSPSDNSLHHSDNSPDHLTALTVALKKLLIPVFTSREARSVPKPSRWSPAQSSKSSLKINKILFAEVDYILCIDVLQPVGKNLVNTWTVPELKNRHQDIFLSSKILVSAITTKSTCTRYNPMANWHGMIQWRYLIDTSTAIESLVLLNKGFKCTWYSLKV